MLDEYNSTINGSIARTNLLAFIQIIEVTEAHKTFRQPNVYSGKVPGPNRLREGNTRYQVGFKRSLFTYFTDLFYQSFNSQLCFIAFRSTAASK